MFKFIHAADIHLDSPLRGLEKYEGAPVQQIRDASRKALENLIELAIDEQVAFVLIAGDLYDGDWREFRTGLHFIKQANRLRDAGIQLFMIAGNHDAANRMTKSLNLPENVTFFKSNAPHSSNLDSVPVVVHGQSFATVAVTEDLSQNYPTASPGMFNIGLLHTCGNGREGHERYAPCSVEGLKLKGYDYWALGHIHLRETLCEKPYIAFSGNIQGRHARETGPKGALLVSVDESFNCHVDFKPLDVVRWEVARIDASEAVSIESLADLVRSEIETQFQAAGERILALRLIVHGTSSLHDSLLAKRNYLINEFRSIANDIGQGDVWLEKVKIETSPLESTVSRSTISDDALGEIKVLFEQLKSNPLLLDEIPGIGDAIKKLPAELKDNSAEWLDGVIDEARSRLIDLLHGSEVPS